MKTISFGPFAGVNNRLPDFSLRATKERLAFLKQAENVDIDGYGNVVPRQVASLVQTLTDAHSLSPDGRYLVRGGVLYAVTLPSYSETLVKVLTTNDPVFWQEFNGDLYYANATDSGRLSGGVWYPLAMPTPDSPAVADIPGALPRGYYQVAVSYYNELTGEEGGVSPSCNEEIGAGGIRVALPPATPGATHVRVYVSTVNGAIPMYHGQASIGANAYDIQAPAPGPEAVQRYEAPLPGGRLFWFNGRLCSYRDNCVYEGLPFRPGYYLPAEGRIPFPGQVSNCIPAQDGCYVVADKTYFIPGDRLQADQGVVMDVLPYGGVPGTAFAAPNKTLYGWFGNKGIVLAKPSGEVEAVMSDNIDVGALPASGLSIVFENRGYRRVVSCGWCLNLDNLAVTTYTNYTFTSAGGGYATRSDGLYALAGDGVVDWSVSLGRQDFGVEQLKSLPAIYLGCASSQPMGVQIKIPGAEYLYLARSCSSDLQEHRVDPGKGLRANWFELSLTGSFDFTLASVSFGPVASTRRI